jgi:hypothetical protein
MANQRASTISMKQIASAADSAIKLAADKHKIQFQSQTLTYVPDWQTLGGILSPVVNLANVTSAAQDITSKMNQAAGGVAAAAGSAHFEPVVIWTGNHIICGARPAPQIVIGE